MVLSPNARLGRYEIRALLGQGGMGEVYLARDPKIGRDVAIKVLPAQFSSDAERLARFEQEARAAGALNHPNVVAVHDVGQQDGSPFVVSELLAGETLRAKLEAPRFRSVRPSTSPRKSRAASPPRTSAELCTATSSLRTSSSLRTGARRFWTSGWRS